MANRYRVRIESRYRRQTLFAGLSAAVLLTYGAAGWGHHSYAMFDMQRVVEVTGTVKEFRYVNPHSWIVLAVQGGAAESTDLRIEAGGPGYLGKFGWKRDSLQPGEKIIASINPLRDGTLGGSLVKVKLNDDRELMARPPPVPAGETK